ncbi:MULTISPECIES: restriction endonuclease subunit S [Klebsiella pneumoniae complex]|uniref:restriction endonuclease subunit S n=1 Tax=Klebsiella pneumoniae complex TaxID=3390273 RepID=UPI000CEC0D73|nr:restriction endonuclease subunit S [Klebsiella pneumoniae]HBV1837749.1 restriction endonuclease subunit S [Klebsiella quasipneumoniae]HDS7208187.1 restriction endonuclease subunit S [Klebsiella quasipneumoniae subsp. similipneumoniae]MBX4559993.1 restriction endonuclease [Klebsiella pneumoniae]MCB8426447.1 restriction endonuclease subunit S [Klebsiella pneumoniae]MCB8461757.1 restriction endonuclease subunit S [Klebsiella pneumoniae]
MAKYKAYPEYKDSGVEWLGKVPNHWEILSAKRMFQSVRTPAYKSDEQLAASQKYGVIPQSLMMQLNDSKVMLALKGTESFRHVEANNFVISLRSFEGGIEYSQYTGCVSPAYTVLKNSKPISYGYYRYLLKCTPFIAALQSSTDSLRDGKSINYEQFSALSLPLSSVQEQNVIAAFLDHETAKIDNLIEKQQQLIELLKEKRQAVISHAVTKGLNPDVPMKDSGVEWLGEVPEHWRVSRIKNYAKIESGHTPSRTKPEYWVSCNIPWVSLNDSKQLKEVDYIEDTLYKISELGMANSSAHLLPARAVVFTRDASIGLSAITTKSMAVSQHLIAWICDEKFIIPEFLLLVFYAMEKEFERYTFGATIKTIGMDNVRGLKSTFPPIEEQRNLIDWAFSKIEKIKSSINKVEDMLSLLQERRTALISAAVTGKIDVRDWVAPDTQDVEEPQEATA